MKKTLIFLLIILCSGFVFYSCKEDDECRTDRYVRMYAFFKRLSIVDGDTTTVTLRIDTLSIHGLGVNTMLYDTVVNKDSVRLPLNKFADMSQFVFNVKDSIIDTISIYHINKEEYLSFECGILTTFIIDKERTTSTNHYIDSISVKQDTVDARNAEHIYIYHTPR